MIGLAPDFYLSALHQSAHPKSGEKFLARFTPPFYPAFYPAVLPHRFILPTIGESPCAN